MTRFGLFVLLSSGVEGLLPVENLPGRGYHYDELHLTLSEEGGQERYTFGMPMEVVCAAADPSSGQIDFVLPGSTLQARPTAGRANGRIRPHHEKNGRNEPCMYPKGERDEKSDDKM